VICITGQEEEGRLLGVVINLLLFPFQRHVEMFAYGRDKMGCANNEPQGKGINSRKALL
jgi:hypothetical protein